MADIADIRELARSLCLMNIANGAIDLNRETVSNLDYLYEILKQELELRAKKKANEIYKGHGAKRDRKTARGKRESGREHEIRQQIPIQRYSDLRRMRIPPAQTRADDGQRRSGRIVGLHQQNTERAKIMRFAPCAGRCPSEHLPRRDQRDYR